MIGHIKRAQLKALRSEDYKQRRLRLYNKGNNSFCCLGVLDDLYRKEHNMEGHPYHDDYYLDYDVVKWAGLETDNPKINGVKVGILNDSLGDMRAEKHDFKMIANKIDEHL